MTKPIFINAIESEQSFYYHPILGLIYTASHKTVKYIKPRLKNDKSPFHK